jgi:hypothetical protein
MNEEIQHPLNLFFQFLYTALVSILSEEENSNMQIIEHKNEMRPVGDECTLQGDSLPSLTID